MYRWLNVLGCDITTAIYVEILEEPPEVVIGQNLFYFHSGRNEFGIIFSHCLRNRNLLLFIIFLISLISDLEKPKLPITPGQ